MELTHQQKAVRTIREQDELLRAQEQLISVLKEQIRHLHKQPSQGVDQIENKLLSSELEIHKLRMELHNMRENNESLIQTFQAYKQVISDGDAGQIKRSSSEKRIAETATPLSESLQARIRLLNQDREASIQTVEPDSQSPYCLLYQYEFTEAADSRYWETEILEPYRSNCSNLQKVRTKLRSIGAKRTFPEQYRHLFWRLLVENSLEITPKLFDMALERAAGTPKLTIVSMDLKRLNVLLDAEASKDIICDIEQCVYAFLQLRPDVGYVQGMPYFLWMLLVRLNKFQSFKLFCTFMVKDPLLHGLMTFSQPIIQSVLDFFSGCLRDKRPKVSQHMEAHGITPDIYLVEWAYTFFSRAFSLSLASKIWDMWLCEGSSVFFRTALAIFELAEQELLEKSYEGTLQTIKTCCHRLKEEQLVRSIRKQKLAREWRQ